MPLTSTIRKEHRGLLSRPRNFIVMSDTGRPIFARYGSEEEIAKTCGLLQAIRSSIQSDAFLGDIRSLRSGELSLVFMIVNSLTLVAIGKDTDSVAFLKLQLEYIFAQIIFTVTEKAQEYYTVDPGFDLRSLLGNTDDILRGILDESEPDGNPAAYFVGGIEPLFPFSPVIRARTSSLLKVVGLRTDYTIFAILAVGERLLSLVQPAFPAHQMKMSDLHLLLKFINRQPGLLSSELWIPVCLPRFSSQDFLFCYTQCMEVKSKLCLILLSQQGTPEQFNLFRKAAANIRRSLDLPPPPESVLEIFEETEDPALDNASRDIRWRRSDEDIDHDEDYVDAAGDGDKMIPYVPGRTDDNPLLKEITAASKPETLKKILDSYLEIASAWHFLFRIDAALQGAARKGSKGTFTQCISSSLEEEFADGPFKNRIWDMYQKLGLRLRLGSATSESVMDAFDMITQDHIETSKNEGLMAPGISRHCPATALAEAQANTDGIAYVHDNTELFFAMNGPDFELYMVLACTTSLKQAAALGAALTRRLLADKQNLFLLDPLTWDA